MKVLGRQEKMRVNVGTPAEMRVKVKVRGFI